MYTRMAPEKKPDPYGGGRNSNSQRKPSSAENKPKKLKVRTMDYLMIMQLILKNPDAILPDELLLLQRSIGTNEALLFIKKARQQKQLEKMGITGEIKQVTLAQFNQNIIQQSIQKKSQDVNPKAGQAKKDIYIAQGQKEHLSHNNKESRNGETQLEENTIMVSNSRNRNINQMADNNNVVANLAYDTQKNSSISFKKYVDKKLDEDLIKDIVNDVIDQVKKNGKLTESQLNDLESILNKEDNSLFGIFNSVSRGVLVIKLAMELSKTGYVSVTKKEGKYELRNVSKKVEQGSNKNEQAKKNDDKDNEKKEDDQKDNDDGKNKWGMGEDGPPDGWSEKGKENDKGTGKTEIDWKVTDELRKKYPQQSAFIDKILPYVIKVYEDTGIPWQFLLAQVCIESSYGANEIKDIDTGELSKNLFGIKYYGDTSDRNNYVRAWTSENISSSELSAWEKQHPELKVVGKTSNGKVKIKIIDNFAKFDTYDSAFDGYKKVLLNSNFKHALSSKDDPIKYVKDIQSELPGENHKRYALNDDYVKLMTSVMKMWKTIK